MSAPLYESLRWHRTSEQMPPDERTVIAWIAWSDSDSDWAPAWRCEGQWRLLNSGGTCGGVVTHWAEPSGPEDEL